MYRYFPLALIALPILLTAISQGQSPREFSPLVDETGAISRPEGFKETMIHIGTYAAAPDPGEPISRIKGIYTRPEDAAAFRRDGVFPDGAVLVKEVYAAAAAETTAGISNYAKGEPVVRFVMIKDHKSRFPDNPLWAEGWGWARFEPADWDQNVATSFQKDCRACHEPAAETDWIYAFGYPALHAK